MRYDPNVSTDFRHGSTDPVNAWANMSSDVTLMHELVHVKEIQEGTFSDDRLGDRATIPADSSIRVDEYEAVGIGDFAGTYSENDYRAERDALTEESIPQREVYSIEGADPTLGTTRTSLGPTPSHDS